MHPYSTLYLATERAKDMREQAAAARRASEARRARRGPGTVLVSGGHVRRHGTPRWA
jgi:hypothetical protein